MNLFSEKEFLELAESIDSLTITIKPSKNFADIIKDVSKETIETKKRKGTNPELISDDEILKALEDCMNNPDCNKKEKNKKFKVGDIVYLGRVEGEVMYKDNNLHFLQVLFQNGLQEKFTFKGEVFPYSPIVLSRFPYELKMKKFK